MRIVFLKDVFERMLRKKRITVYVFAVSLLIGLLFGFLRHRSIDSENYSYLETESYEQALENFEVILAEVADSVAVSETQAKEAQDYIDNSIYMKLDPDAIETGVLTYTLTVADGVNFTDVSNSYIVFINDGSFKENLCAKVEGLDTNYLKEVTFVAASADSITLTFYHYDRAVLESMMSNSIDIIKIYSQNVAKEQGDHSLVLMDQTCIQTGNQGVRDNQNGRYNDLKNYQNSLEDYKRRQIDQTSSRDNYIASYEPSETEKSSLLSKLVIFGVLFLVIGFIAEAGVMLFIIMFSKRIETETDITLSADVNIIGRIMEEDDKSVEYESVKAVHICEKQDIKRLALVSTLEKENYSSLFDSLRNSFERNNIEVTACTDVLCDKEALTALLKTENVLFVESIGVSNYKVFYDTVKLCRDNKLNIIGLFDFKKEIKEETGKFIIVDQILNLLRKAGSFIRKAIAGKGAKK